MEDSRVRKLRAIERWRSIHQKQMQRIKITSRERARERKCRLTTSTTPSVSGTVSQNRNETICESGVC